jgi:predicted RNA-binding Zn-ribbon protein involved in translation (DUF1610 family)
MEVIQGETIKLDDVAPAPKDTEPVVQGMTVREAEIAEVKRHAEELQQSVEGSYIHNDLINRGTTPKVKDEDDDDDVFTPSTKLKLYSIHCEICGFKKLTDGSDVAGLVPYKQARIPGGSPYRDPATGEIVTPMSRPNSKKFKCPKCGRVVTVRKVADPNNYTGRSYDE